MSYSILINDNLNEFFTAYLGHSTTNINFMWLKKNHDKSIIKFNSFNYTKEWIQLSKYFTHLRELNYTFHIIENLNY